MTWLALAALGVYHGVNPGMGWLFAVALGLQEGRSRAVWRALPPIALGHALAVGAAVAVAFLLGEIVPIETLKMVVGVVLILFGLSRLVRMRHPRWASMRVGFAKLTLWSFLMASAHGAGLMLLPWVLPTTPAAAAAGEAPATVEGAHCHTMVASHAAGAYPATASAWPALASITVHTLGYLLAMSLVAWLVYAKLGVAILRKAWLNLEGVWAVALIAAGAVAWLS